MAAQSLKEYAALIGQAIDDKKTEINTINRQVPFPNSSI